jgi:hypothetical protein
MNTLVISLALWGERYRNRFLDWTIKSFLAKNNLPKCIKKVKIVFFIITTQDDKRVIESHPSIILLKNYAEIQYEEINFPTSDVSKYNVLSGCHDYLIDYARSINAWIMITNPDSFYADGSISALIERIISKQTCIMSTAISVNEVSFKKWVDSRFVSEDALSIEIASRDLVRGMLINLHETERTAFYNSLDFTVHPSQIHWRLNETSFFSRIAHRCPIVFKPKGDGFKLTSTYDDSYLKQAHIPISEISYITDSDEFLCAHIVGDDYQKAYTLGRAISMFEFAIWIKRTADFYHRKHLNKLYTFKSEEINPIQLKYKGLKSFIYVYLAKLLSLLPKSVLKTFARYF